MAVTRRRLLRLAGGLAGAAALAACGSTTFDQSGSADAPADLLYIDTKDGLTVLNTASRAPAAPASNAISGADWSRLHVSAPAGADTRLTTLDAATGQRLNQIDLPGRLVARVASASGRLVALTEPTPAGQAGRESTRLVVVDPADARAPVQIELPGNYEPEAFSADDGQVFVIEYLPALNPDRYRVRACTLATGTVGPLLTRLKTVVPAGAEEEMDGEGRQAVLAPERDRLYTLYTRQPDHLHTRDLLAGRTARDRAGVYAFVHTLSLDQGWAFCIDLPAPFGLGPAAAHTLAIAPDGRRLFVADRSSGQLAVADTEQLAVTRGVALGGSDEIKGAAAAQVAPDGTRLYLAGGPSVLAVDSASLTVAQTWTVNGDARGLALSPDGRRLYVGQEGRVLRLDSATGRETGRLSAPNLSSLRHAGTLPASGA